MYDPITNYHIACAKQENLLREAAEDRLAGAVVTAHTRRLLSGCIATMIRTVMRARIPESTPQTAPRSAPVHE
jgi:hypothetical protein